MAVAASCCLLRGHDGLGAGVDLLLGGADVLAQGLGGRGHAGVGGFQPFGEDRILLVSVGDLLVGGGEAALQGVAPDQRADAEQKGDGNHCDECSRGGPLGYDHWFGIAHEFLPLVTGNACPACTCGRVPDCGKP